MSISIVSNGDKTTYAVNKYVLDTEEDIANLPVNCSPGSTAFCIPTGKTYLKNASGTWVEHKGASSGDGSGSIDKDEIINAAVEQVENNINPTLEQLSDKVANAGDYEKLINKPYSEEVRELIVEWDEGEGGGSQTGEQYALKLGEKYVLTAGDQEYIFQAYNPNRFVKSSYFSEKAVDNIETDSKVMQEPSDIVLLPINTYIIPQDSQDFLDQVDNLDFWCTFNFINNILNVEDQRGIESPPAGKLEHITYKKIEPQYIPYHTQLRRKIIDNLYFDESTDINGNKTTLQKEVIFDLSASDWPQQDKPPIFFLPSVTYEIKINDKIYYAKGTEEDMGTAYLNVGPFQISFEKKVGSVTNRYTVIITLSLDIIPDIQLPINLSVTEIWKSNTNLTPLYTLEYSSNEIYEEEMSQTESGGPILDINKAILELQGAIHDILEYLYEKENNDSAQINDSSRIYLKPYFKHTNLLSLTGENPTSSDLDPSQFGTTLYKTIKQLQNFVPPYEIQE